MTVKILKLIAYISIAYIGIVGLLYSLQSYIIFLPKALPANFIFNFNYPYQELELYSADKVSINALYFKTDTISKGIVVYFHGNADNLQRWGQYHSDFTARGYDFLAIDYRGYGKSGGDISEAGLYADATAAYDWARARYAADSIILYGRSLGTGIASHLACRVPARMLILETPYDNLSSVARKRFPFILMPFDLNYHFQNDQNIPKVPYPVYVFHGTDDEVVPYRCAANLKEAIKQHATAADFYTIDGGKHKNLGEFELYQSSLDSLLGPKY